MKKNNKILIIVSIILLNVLVLYMVGQSLLGKTSSYDKHLEQARAYAQQELCSKSIDKYKEALTVKDTLAVRLETIAVLEKGMHIGEFANTYDVYNTVNSIVEDYREDAAAYESACDFFFRYGKYDECAKALMQARDLKVTSDKIEELRQKVRYQYERKYSMYDTVLPCMDGYYTVSADGTYLHLDDEGAPYSSGAYTYASSLTNGYAFAKAAHPEETEKSFIMNEAEQRQVYLEGVTSSSGVGAGEDKYGNTLLLLSCKVGERYKYYTVDGKEAFGDYLFAGKFRNNVAAVKETEGSWKLIDATGRAIVDTVFTDVVLNEFEECAPKGLIIANDGSGYHLYNYKGKQIGDFTCDGAKAFVDDYAAFKKGELWGFVDAEGKVIIEAQYEDAKSFSNKMAGVKKGDMWNFINVNNEIVINEPFEDVGYLNDKGICFVKTDGYWSNLKFFYTGE